jgi:hypothetical protein
MVHRRGPTAAVEAPDLALEVVPGEDPTPQQPPLLGVETRVAATGHPADLPDPIRAFRRHHLEVWPNRRPPPRFARCPSPREGIGRAGAVQQFTTRKTTPPGDLRVTDTARDATPPGIRNCTRPPRAWRVRMKRGGGHLLRSGIDQCDQSVPRIGTVIAPRHQLVSAGVSEVILRKKERPPRGIRIACTFWLLGAGRRR